MRCSSCKSDVVPVKPRTRWKILTVAFWIGALATSLVFSLLLGLNIVLVPLWLVNGMAVGIAARRLASYSCPVCHAEMAAPPAAEPTTEDRATQGRLVPRPA